MTKFRAAQGLIGNLATPVEREIYAFTLAGSPQIPFPVKGIVPNPTRNATIVSDQEFASLSGPLRSDL